MPSKHLGAQTMRFAHPPAVRAYAAIGGRMEEQGPLGRYFDRTETDSFFGEDTWEKAESAMQKRAFSTALEKGLLQRGDVQLLIGGDLLNQCIATSFALRDFNLPFYGLYSACATMGESLALGAALIDGGFFSSVGAIASSHFCAAERQYRMPTPYGSQRTPTAQWTATACGCCLLGDEGPGPFLTHATCGRIVDKGVSDVSNMGAAMAPAAYDTLSTYFRDTGERPEDFDLILSGDLGKLGSEIVVDLFRQDGLELSKNYFDCGVLLYDIQRQDMHCGGSGAGCSAAVLCSYLLENMRQGKWNRILFAPTGALLSPTSSFQGESIPGICHAVVISNKREGKA